MSYTAHYWGDGDLHGQAHLDSHHGVSLSADAGIVQGAWDSQLLPGCGLGKDFPCKSS